MKALQLLNRNEMKNIKGGYMEECTCHYEGCDVTVTDTGSGAEVSVACGDGFTDSFEAGPNDHGTACGGVCSW